MQCQVRGDLKSLLVASRVANDWNMFFPSLPLIFCLIALGSASMWRDAATQSIENYVRVELGHQGDFEVQIHLLEHDARRSFTTILSGVFGFLVRSGVVEDFRVTCRDFLRRTGRVVLGEILSQWGRTNKRHKRQTHIISESDFNDGSDVAVVCTSGRTQPSNTSEASGEQSSVPKSEEVGEASDENKIREYLDDYIKVHRNSYKRSGTTWNSPVLPYQRVFSDMHWVKTGGLPKVDLLYRDNVNPRNVNATEYCLISDLKCQIVVGFDLVQNHTTLGCGESPTMTLAFQFLEWELEDEASLELCYSMKYSADYLRTLKPFYPKYCTTQFMNRFRKKNIWFTMKTVASTFRFEPRDLSIQSVPRPVWNNKGIWRDEDCKYRLFTADD